MEILEHNQNPESVLDERFAKVIDGHFAADCFAVPFSYRQYYLPGEPLIDLVAMYQIGRAQDGIQIDMAVSSEPLSVIRELGQRSNLESIAAALATPLLGDDQIIRLETVAIPKPWGREIWYTGIEQRGVSAVTDGRFNVPLPWFMAIAPGRLAGHQEKRLNLLKILDPLPQEIYGDLYFELHEAKQEVYVVTNVDRSAWPDGVGAIRFGFDQKKRQSYKDDQAFREAYVNAVRQYRQIRKQIDDLLDQLRSEEGIDLNVPVPANTLQEWQRHLPKALVVKEADFRQEMDSFSSLRPLRVGDVVQVPLLTPHALQRGVRAVEFQTPVYERKILSFAQKVLTQKNWDTDDAASIMTLDAPEHTRLHVAEQGEGHLLERVVDFDDFSVKRLTLEPGSSWVLEQTGAYKLIMSVNGGVMLSNVELRGEQACFAGVGHKPVTLCASGASAAIVLIAEPRQIYQGAWPFE